MTEETHYVIKYIDLQSTVLGERALQKKKKNVYHTRGSEKEIDR